MSRNDAAVAALLTVMWETLHITAQKSCADAVQDLTIDLPALAALLNVPLADASTFEEIES